MPSALTMASVGSGMPGTDSTSVDADSSTGSGGDTSSPPAAPSPDWAAMSRW